MQTYDFRYDYLGLSTDAKPSTSEVPDGCTFYAVDTSSLYIKYGSTWYEQH